MGGLLSRTMAVSSGDQFWRLYSDRPFEARSSAPREVLDELRRYFFFEPLPFVKRVVFLATPHRGSDMSRGVVGRVGTSLISDPDHIHKLLYQLVKDNPDAFDSRRFRRLADEHRDPRDQLAHLDGAARTCSRRRHKRCLPLDHRLEICRPASPNRPTAWSLGPARTSTESSRRRSCDRTMASRRTPRRFVEVGRILREHVGVSNSAEPGSREAPPLAGPGCAGRKLEMPRRVADDELLRRC